jgi:Xaa-Pro aminopeptidase
LSFSVALALWVFLQSKDLHDLYISARDYDLDTIPNFSHLADHCADASPIGNAEFYQRQKSLARILHSLNASAYIAEPGANAQFFGNISSSQWHLSERPLLLIVSPYLVNEGVEAKITVVTPSFEATRAKLLHIPSASNVAFAEWPEDVNPYNVAVSAIPASAEGRGTIFVDGSIRHFVVDGLAEAGPKLKISSAPLEIRHLREKKSAAEIELLKCANEAGFFSNICASCLLIVYR